MPDRLSELVRQRTLVSEHLAWLDREIASANGKLASPASAPLPSPLAPPLDPTPLSSIQATATVAAVASAAVPKPAEVTLAAPEVILDQYRVEPSTVKQDVRKGCLLYFAGAFVVLGVIVAILYFALGPR